VALHGMWWFQFTAQSVEQSRQTALELQAIATETGQVELEIAAHRALGYSCWMSGDFETGLAEFERGSALYDPDQHRPLASRLGGSDPGVGLNSLGSNSAWYLGWPDRALCISRRNLSLLEKLKLPISECWARVNLAQVNQLRGSPDAVRKEAGRVLEIANELAYPLYIGWAMPLYGWSMIGHDASHEDDDAISLIRKGIQTSDKTGTIVQGTTWRGLLAEACLQAGEFAEGLAALDAADALAARNNERMWAAELVRLRGLIHLARNRDEAPHAEQLFRRAIEIARQKKAKSWELRASVSLAQLWADRGERQKALDLLAPVYGWFTEGFETADLIEAKTLLDDLA
jgi:tetratricopeptide (TPR) repeat protein